MNSYNRELWLSASENADLQHAYAILGLDSSATNYTQQ